VVAAFYGKADKITLLIRQGINVNAFPDGSSGFHSHATALHQAIYSGSLETVKLLVEAGARLDLEDRVYQGTPIGWAEYMIAEESDELTRPKFKQIRISQ
jgi:peptide-methionine (S)-S-oxide reductase